MIKRAVFAVFLLIFSSGVMFVSVVKSASVKYQFGKSPLKQYLTVNGVKIPEIDYLLPDPGTVLPDNPLWAIKTLRDKIWLALTIDTTKKSELLLLLADKRLSSSRILFEEGNSELGFKTLLKGEKYLSEACDHTLEKIYSVEYLNKIALASLKHRQVIEQILPIAPEGAKPELVKALDYSKEMYKSARDHIRERDLVPPIDPFLSE